MILVGSLLVPIEYMGIRFFYRLVTYANDPGSSVDAESFNGLFFLEQCTYETLINDSN